MEFKIEMLLRIENIKNSVYSKPSKIIELLKLNDDFFIIKNDKHYRLKFEQKIFDLTVTRESQYIYSIIISSPCGQITSDIDISNELDELAKVGRKIKITLSDNIKDVKYEVLWDDVGIYYAKLAFPYIINIENLMRKIITKFMLVSVGIDFFKEIPEDISVRENQNDDSGFLHNIDFIDLTKYLFHERPLKKIESLIEIINSLQENTLPDGVNLLEYQSESYWNRYFRDSIDQDVEALFIKKKWEELYKLRCKVAHSRFLKKAEYHRIQTICSELETIFNAALDRLENIHLTEESKETISDEIFLEIEGETWNKKLFTLIINNFEDEFTLNDCYERFTLTLQEIYPENNTIRASIRRNLQVLRNLKKIQFLNNGKYKILDRNYGDR